MQRFTLFYILQIWAQRFNVFQDYELNQILTFIKYPKPKILLQHQKVDNQMSNWLYPFKAWVCFVFDAFFFKKKKNDLAFHRLEQKKGKANQAIPDIFTE